MLDRAASCLENAGKFTIDVLHALHVGDKVGSRKTMTAYTS